MIREEMQDGTPDHVVMADPEGNECLPLGLNATAFRPPLEREPVCSGAPTWRSVAGFHSRTVSSPPEALASS